MKISKADSKILLTGSTTWSDMRLDLEVLLFTLEPEHSKVALLGFSNYVYQFCLSPKEFSVWKGGNEKRMTEDNFQNLLVEQEEVASRIQKEQSKKKL